MLRCGAAEKPTFLASQPMIRIQKTMIQRILPLVLMATVCLALLHADQQEEKPIVEYVWVRGKLAEMANDSQVVVTLNRDEIRTLPVAGLVDLLALLPGVHLSRKGPMGAVYDVSFRGGNFEQTLIMIDGVAWNNSQTGHFNADLPVGLEEIESVQLIRGGNGARYGSSFAGAINIVTRRRTDLAAMMSAGQYGLLSSGFSGGAALADGLKLLAGLRYDCSDGFYSGRENRQLALNTSLNWENRVMALNADFGCNRKQFGAAGFYAPLPSREESDATMLNLHWRLKGDGRSDPLRLSLSRQTHDDYFELDRNRPEYFSNRSRTERWLVMAESVFRLPLTELRLGGDLNLDRMDSLAMGRPRESGGDLYLNGQWGRARLTLDWGLRGQWWQGHRPALVYYGGLAWQAAPAWLIKFSLGKSTRRPNFTERFYQSPTNGGAEDLRSELSYNYELSLMSPRRFGLFEISLFHRRQRYSIDWVDRIAGEAVFWQAVNLAPYSVDGVEFAYTVALGGHRLNLGLERTWSRGAAGVGYASKYGFRFPDLVLRTSGLMPFGAGLSLSWTYQFKRLLASAETAQLVDLQLQCRFGGKFTLVLLGQNLANQLYEEIAGVKVSGRWFSLSVRYGS